MLKPQRGWVKLAGHESPKLAVKSPRGAVLSISIVQVSKAKMLKAPERLGQACWEQVSKTGGQKPQRGYVEHAK